MAEIALHNDRANAATYIPNTFIDHYMTTANGEYVKIYLYLLRCVSSPNCGFSLTKAADKFEHTEKDIQRALKYWEKMKLLRLEYDAEKKLSSIYFLDSNHPEETVTLAASNQEPSLDYTPKPVSLAAAEDEKPQHAQTRSYTAGELAAFQEKDNVRELLFVTEHYLKRPLTTTDINIILYWFEELHFTTDLIEFLIEYCLGKGHTSLRYMNKVALSWKDEGVVTVEQAKRASSSFSQIHNAVMRALGIQGRNLVSSEIALIDSWTKKMGFSQEIILEACRRTIAATHQPSFEYTDKILANWSRQQVTQLPDIARLDSAYQKAKPPAPAKVKAAAPNKFNNFPQRTYDYDKLEQQLLNRKSSQEVTCP